MLDTLITIAVWVVVILCGLIALYLLYGFGVMLCLGAYAGVSNLLVELHVRRRMRLAGRFLPWRKALGQIQHLQGTVILQSPTIGWRISRAWWTPDDVVAEAPVPPPDTSERDPEVLSRHPFIEWCHEHYTDLDRGAGYLIAVYRGDRYVERLVARFPSLKKVDLWSGGSRCVIGLTE